MPDDKNLRYRYPGTKPFEADEHELFKGRDDEVQGLSELIALNNLVVLFGRSGLGKSSLLNAGLVNCFHNRANTAPLFVRFGAYYGENTASPLAKLHDAVTTHTEAENASSFIYEKLIPKDAVAPQNLWYLFKSRQLAHPQQQSIVLIFDQFEETFTYPEADVEAFKKELSELLFVSVPQQLRNILKEELRLNPAYLTEKEKEFLFRPLNVKALFSIRSDKLSLLNNFTDCFPSVLNTCYELKPLSKEQARQAVVEPARLDDKRYASPPFTFTADAVALLLEALTRAKRSKEPTASGHNTEIETFQLQIVCRHAENKVMEKGLREITAADLGDIKAIFENHYHNIVDKFPEALRLPAQRLMEEKLIIDGNRVSMPIPFILRDEGMTPELLDELINTHLLRREQANTVEISHDTLVEPILKQYEERKKREDVAAELREKEAQINKIRKEQEEQAAAQKQKAKRNRVLLSVVSIALILMIVLAGYAFRNARDADVQRNNAERGSAIVAASSEAFRLILRARQVTGEDPAIGLRIAEAAMKKFPDPLIVDEAKHIYLEHDFYRTVGTAEESTVGALSPDGTRVLFSKFPSLRLVNNGYGQSKAFGPNDEDRNGNRIYSVAFSPDGNTFLTGLGNGTIELWNTDRSRLREYKGPGWAVQSLSFSADGTEFLSASGDTAILWNIEGDPLLKVEHKGGIASVALSRDKRSILTGSWDSTVRLWKRNGALIQKQKEDLPVNSLAFSADEANVFIGSMGYVAGKNNAEAVVGTVRLWHWESNSIKPLIDQKADISTIAFPPEGTRILIGLNNGTVEIRDENGGLLTEVKAHKKPVSLAVLSSTGNTLLTGSANDSLKLWYLADVPVKKFEAHEAQVNLAAFSADGAKFITGSDDGTARLWSTNSGLLQTLKEDGAVSSVDMSGDGEFLLTASTDGTAKLWDGNGKLLHTLKKHTGAVQSVALLKKDKSKVLTGSDDGTAILWSIGGDSLLTLKGHTSGVVAVAFSPDGTKFLTGSRDSTARLWNAKGDLLHVFKGHTGSVYAVAFSQGGSRILTGAEDTTAILWNVNGDSLRRFKGHANRIWSVAFAPDPTKIITGSLDGTAKVWNVNGELIRVIKAHDDGVSCAIFSPDGKKILTTSWDKTVKLWNSGRLLTLEEFLKSDAVDKLTSDQKKEFRIQ